MSSLTNPLLVLWTISSAGASSFSVRQRMSPGVEASVGDKVGGEIRTEGQDLDWDIKMEDMEVMKGGNRETGDFTQHC